MANLRAERRGTAWLLYPLTDDATAWVTEHIGAHHGWAPAIVVEHGRIADILASAVEDGLELVVTKSAKGEARK